MVAAADVQLKQRSVSTRNAKMRSGYATFVNKLETGQSVHEHRNEHGDVPTYEGSSSFDYVVENIALMAKADLPVHVSHKPAWLAGLG
jgi:hypothetical protein